MSAFGKSGDVELDGKIEEWLKWDKNDNTRSEIEKLAEEGDYEKLKTVLLTRMSFGTAGLRGRMTAGYAGMNDLVIIQTSQGLAKYLQSSCPEAKKGVVIGYDGRHHSHRFAQLAAAAFLACDIPVYLFSKMVATPYIPFTVSHLKLAAGIMVTASHNPKDDNGYKVYWTNGAQIIEPHDKGIQNSILHNLAPWENAWKISILDSHPDCNDPLKKVNNAYYTFLESCVIDKKCNSGCKTKFTFTPMHGVSHSYMVKAFEVCGFQPYIPVVEQINPDPEFPTVKFPNPEEGKSALDLAMKTADTHGSTVILANDPDADRLAVAEKHEGQWKVFTGNEIGALLGWWLWHCHKSLHPETTGENVYMIASTVSSKILRAIGNKEGFNFIETLTGFKWMGNKSYELIKQGKTVLLAFEEAIGFMCNATVLDKDGMSAAIKIAELTAFLETKGLTLTNQLHKIFSEYGYHVSINSYYLCYDQHIIKQMFERLRNFSGPQTYSKSCKNWTISSVRDLTTGYDNSMPDNKAILPSSSSSQMITFQFENGCVATFRTSGTEPKIKYYTELCAKPGQDNWKSLDKELSDMVSTMVEEFMEPTKNKLIPRSE